MDGRTAHRVVAAAAAAAAVLGIAVVVIVVVIDGSGRRRSRLRSSCFRMEGDPIDQSERIRKKTNYLFGNFMELAKECRETIPQHHRFRLSVDRRR